MKNKFNNKTLNLTKYKPIGLNFYHAVTNKDSFFKIFKYTLFFVLFYLSLIATQKYFIINYGYSSISRYDVNFSLENHKLNVNLKNLRVPLKGLTILPRFF